MRKSIQHRLEQELVKRIDHLGIDFGLTRQDTVEILLTAAIDDGNWHYESGHLHFTN